MNRKDQSLEEKLIAAAAEGNAAMVEHIIRKGININYIDNHEIGYTALHYAAFNGYNDVVVDLIIAGANVNAVTKDNFTPMMLAVIGGFPDVVDNLFKISSPDLSIRTKDSSQPHDYLNCMHLAVMSGSEAIVRFLIKQGVETDAVTNTGYTALHLAAEAGHSHIIAAIIELVPFLNCAQYILTGDSKTSLHLAVSSGVQESVVLLLSQQTSTINITDKDGYTPLHLAVVLQYKNIAEILLRACAVVNTVAWDSHSPLLDAVLNGDSRMIDVLVKYNADQTVRDMNGITALMSAAKDGSESIVRSLLSAQITEAALRSLCNLQDNRGNTALHYAVELGLEGIIKRLVKAGAAVTIPDENGRTSLDLAATFSNRKINTLLKRAFPPLTTPVGIYSTSHTEVASEYLVAVDMQTENVVPPVSSLCSSHMVNQSAILDSITIDDSKVFRNAIGSVGGVERETVHVPQVCEAAQVIKVGEKGEESADILSDSSSIARNRMERRRRSRISGICRKILPKTHRDAAISSVKSIRRRTPQQRQRCEKILRGDNLYHSNDVSVESSKDEEGSHDSERDSAKFTLMQAESALYKLQGQYVQKIAVLSERYEARIYALQAQLRLLQGHPYEKNKEEGIIAQDDPLDKQQDVDGVNSSMDWDQEIEFLSPPGTSGEARYAALLSPKHSKTPRAPKTPKSHLKTCISKEATVSASPSAAINCVGHKRQNRGTVSEKSSELFDSSLIINANADKAPKCHDRRTSIIQLILTKFDGTFISLVSVMVVFLAIIMLFFIRVRICSFCLQ